MNINTVFGFTFTFDENDNLINAISDCVISPAGELIRKHEDGWYLNDVKLDGSTLTYCAGVLIAMYKKRFTIYWPHGVRVIKCDQYFVFSSGVWFMLNNKYYFLNIETRTIVILSSQIIADLAWVTSANGNGFHAITNDAKIYVARRQPPVMVNYIMHDRIKFRYSYIDGVAHYTAEEYDGNQISCPTFALHNNGGPIDVINTIYCTKDNRITLNHVEPQHTHYFYMLVDNYHNITVMQLRPVIHN